VIDFLLNSFRGLRVMKKHERKKFEEALRDKHGAEFHNAALRIYAEAHQKLDWLI
jgi:hypothetical protein